MYISACKKTEFLNAGVTKNGIFARAMYKFLACKKTITLYDLIILHVFTRLIPYAIYLDQPKWSRKAVWNKLQA